MKLKNILFCLFVFVFMYEQILAQNTNPVVSNVAFSISGTAVTVTYDVSDADVGNNTVTIIMQVSSDAGVTWDYNYGTANGDIGPNMTTGNGKAINWTYNGVYNSNFQMKIIANDETAGGSSCPGTPTVTHDGKTYNTIQIGDQCWLKENLDVGTMITSNISTDNQTDNGTIEKYCYNNGPNNCEIYGGLYQWDEAMQYSTTPGTQGICPTGWHLPTYAEFQTLIDAAGGSGNALKREDQGNQGTNTSGFSALLAGVRVLAGTFSSLNTFSYIWSSTEGTGDAYFLSQKWNNNNTPLTTISKGYGSSVRCVKDS